jgi:hypothetical protein
MTCDFVSSWSNRGCCLWCGPSLVRISDFDMITVHANATVDDYAHVRAAEVRRGALRVAPVYIGANATVCTRAIVGPGGIVPSGATLGPYMSWRELDVAARGASAQMEEHRKLARMRQDQPSAVWTFLAWPLVLLCEAIVWVPWVIVFVLLIRSQGLLIPGEDGFNDKGNRTDEVTFMKSPASFIKNWLGHYTGADKVDPRLLAPPSGGLMPIDAEYRQNAVNAEAAGTPMPTSRHLLGSGLAYGPQHSQHRYANLIVERGEYMRSAAARTATFYSSSASSTWSSTSGMASTGTSDAGWQARQAQLGQSRNLGQLRNDGATSEFNIAPNPADDGEASFLSFVTDGDRSPPPAPAPPLVQDEEGGETIPRGGFVHAFYYGGVVYALSARVYTLSERCLHVESS